MIVEQTHTHTHTYTYIYINKIKKKEDGKVTLSPEGTIQSREKVVK